MEEGTEVELVYLHMAVHSGGVDVGTVACCLLHVVVGKEEMEAHQSDGYIPVAEDNHSCLLAVATGPTDAAAGRFT